jgi:hypothetical protein
MQMAKFVLVDECLRGTGSNFVSEVEGTAIRGGHPTLSGVDVGNLQTFVQKLTYKLGSWQLIDLEVGERWAHVWPGSSSGLRQDG